MRMDTILLVAGFQQLIKLVLDVNKLTFADD